MKISIIVPFYYGNLYLSRLFKSIEKVKLISKELTEYEVIIVNDSPEVDVVVPNTILNVKVVNNEKNLGIQQSRINGLQYSSGNWILFLDQDDELKADGFLKQIELSKEADVVVGNGIYNLGNINKIIFCNYRSMQYLIQEKNFIKIRNLIPSPGQCLIKRSILPELWQKCALICNGADDWMLWILLFKAGARFACNSGIVYIHNDTSGGNLSADLNKMKKSSLEMLSILKSNNVLDKKELKYLKHGIEFKYNQDTKQLSFYKIFKYVDALLFNIKYRVVLNYLNKL